MLSLPAPAKINLYLHITGERNDGYHVLDTVFQLIDLQDTVRLASRNDGQLRLHTPIAGLPDDQHLATRAARLLKTATSCEQGADIWVDKRIPSGAGLGGGSSDAATTLMGLNHLWQCGLPQESLQTLGLSLGADVPFFVSGLGTAHAAGIGEVLTPLATPRKHFIVVYPNCHVATPTVFKHPALSWNARSCAPAFSNAFAPELGNDLQSVAQQMAPSIGQALAWLNLAPRLEGVRMSGSGSAVFAQFSNRDDVLAANDFLLHNHPVHAKDWSVWTAQALAEHPALRSLQAT
jgi:4-diphosphocytidyl-2-C-methyl-D-erythritol kinase